MAPIVGTSARRSAATGARLLRFPFPPTLLPLPSPWPSPQTAGCGGLPLPAVGRRGTQATGAGRRRGRAAQPVRRADRPAPGHHGRAAPCGDPAGHHRALPAEPQPMYTGHVIVLLGAALRTGSWWPLLVCPALHTGHDKAGPSSRRGLTADRPAGLRALQQTSLALDLEIVIDEVGPGPRRSGVRDLGDSPGTSSGGACSTCSSEWFTAPSIPARRRRAGAEG